MSISFESRVHANYVELICAGTYTFESGQQAFSEAFAAAAREGLSAVLVDVRAITGTPPTLLERFHQGVHVAELQLASRPRIRIAMVGHEPIVHPQRFGEVIAKSRGALAQVFTDMDEAIAWISS